MLDISNLVCSYGKVQAIKGISLSIAQGQLAVLGPGDRITVTAEGSQDSNRPAMEVLLLGGKPIREPVFQYGPFVMNSKSELIEAVEDFNAGKFGTIPPNALMPHRPLR